MLESSASFGCPWTEYKGFLQLEASYCSVAKPCLTLCDPMDCSTLGFLVLHYVPEFAQTYVHWVNDAIQPSHPLSSPSPPALNFPSIRVFSNESTLLMSWPKYWSFSFSISPSSECSGLISFRIEWFGFLVVQGILKMDILSKLQVWNEELMWWNVRRSNQSILKEISPGYSLEGLMLKLKLQYFGHLMQRVDSLEKTLMLGGIEGRRRRGRQRMR